MPAAAHRPFSFGRLAAICGNTLTELIRLKVFYFVLIFALVLIGNSIFMARLSFQQEFQILKDVSLGAISIFTSLLAIVCGARLLPQEIADRTIYTVLAKPVPRGEYLAGKLAGVLLLLAISTAVMSVLFIAVLYAREQTVLGETLQQMAGAPAEQVAEAVRALKASAFNTDLLPGIFIIYLKSCIIAALTLLVSTFASSNIFTIVVATVVYFIGHLQATAREYWLQTNGGGPFSKTFLAVVALLFPDLQMFNVVDDLVVGTAMPMALFLKTAVMGLFYVTVYYLLAWLLFEGKEL